MQTKKCNKCNLEKPVTEYSKEYNKTQRCCKSCATIVSKKWYQDNKDNEEIKNKLHTRPKEKYKYLKNIVNKVKEHYGCCLCNEKDACCLDFHHLNKETKDRNVSHWTEAKSYEKIIREIIKCICVCANCHRKIHAKKIKSPEKLIDHGELIKLIEESKKLFPWREREKKIKKPKIMKNSCPVCHKLTNNDIYCCSKCCKVARRKVIRPSFEKLQEDIKKMSMIKVGKKYNVTGNTIKKWIKNYKKENDLSGT